MWKEKILKAYDRSWIKEIKDKIFDLSHNTAKEMLDHLKNKCLSLINTEKKERLKEAEFLWNIEEEIFCVFYEITQGAGSVLKSQNQLG